MVGSVVGLGLACGLVLRLGLVSGLYKWLFYLATVRQLNNVESFIWYYFRPRIETSAKTTPGRCHRGHQTYILNIHHVYSTYTT